MKTKHNIEVLLGDITKVSADAIVNAANSSLLGGGGVDGAIHRAGGAAILDECRMIRAKQGKCKTGDAVITTAGQLPAKHVIHTVGPVWNGGNHGEASLLRSCYIKSLELAVEHNCSSIAFPNISTGIYRFPKQEAADISISTITEFLLTHSSIQTVKIVCFDEESFSIVEAVLQGIE
ncbi:MAG: O-acetyl-ADP-ribose deacetylase [Candidatus Kapaibacterium sp.]